MPPPLTLLRRAQVHGRSPHLENYEPSDARARVRGIGFSVEPGVYLEGNFGVRSEVNVFLDEKAAVVRPGEIQRELILPR